MTKQEIRRRDEAESKRRMNRKRKGKDREREKIRDMISIADNSGL